jgi:hypothetical protein
MTRKMSAFGSPGGFTAANIDALADYFPAIDASVADAVKNKTMLFSELRRRSASADRPTPRCFPLPLTAPR